MKQSADDNFEFDENTRKFSKRIENTVGEGEIARFEQFLLFPECFQKACFRWVSKGGIVWEWDKQFMISIILTGNENVAEEEIDEGKKQV